LDKIPLILDTDIGSDVDDAVALAYLLRQPRCELLGITTVTGDVAKRCAIAEVLCRAAGRDDVPIHAGASSVLLVGPGQPLVPHYAAIEHLPHRTDYAPNTAVDFLRRTIRARQHEITLLTIGPFTNVALLFALDPEIPSLLKQIVSMAGIYYPRTRRTSKRPREWNCMVDPVATAMVFGAHAPNHTCLGLDVTLQCTMNADDVRDRFSAPLLDVVLPMAELWLAEHETLTFHDPLAAVSVFDPQVCEYESGRIDSPLSSNQRLQGRTMFSPDAAGPHHIAKSVDVQRFFDDYFATFDH
jgi:purine nucleosidase